MDVTHSAQRIPRTAVGQRNGTQIDHKDEQIPQHFDVRTELAGDFLEVLDAREFFANRLGKLACDPISGVVLHLIADFA